MFNLLQACDIIALIDATEQSAGQHKLVLFPDTYTAPEDAFEKRMNSVALIF